MQGNDNMQNNMELYLLTRSNIIPFSAYNHFE